MWFKQWYDNFIWKKVCPLQNCWAVLFPFLWVQNKKIKNTSLIWLYICDHNDCETNRICFTIHNFIENVQNRTKKKNGSYDLYLKSIVHRLQLLLSSSSSSKLTDNLDCSHFYFHCPFFVFSTILLSNHVF